MSSSNQEVPIATSHLREKLRMYCKMERAFKRDCEADSLRLGIGEIHAVITELENLNEKDVVGLCSRIKRRKHATSEDMFRLCHAFLQNNDNIVAFAKTPGAINVIVKELTGHNSELQVKACETLCNLCLGDAVVCEKVATFAGSYLVTYFYSTENRLKRTSLWVIMNIASSGGKGLMILISQEIIPKLVSFYCNEKDVDMLEDVAICLDLVVSSKDVELRSDDIKILCPIISSKSSDSPVIHQHVKISFELISKTNSLNYEDLQYLIVICLEILQNTHSIESTKNYQKLLYSIRVLSNLIAMHSWCAEFLEVKISGNELCGILNKILELDNNGLVKEVLWLVKNLTLNECYFSKDLVVNNLKVKRNSVLCLSNKS